MTDVRGADVRGTDVPAGRIVLAGAAGLLGSAIAALLDPARLVRLGRADLDPADPDAARAAVAALAPGLVINCAADTDVEGAETAPARAFATNTGLAGALALAAADSGAGFVQMSSTGCYGDWKTEPYVEDDPLRPTTVHHQSKAEGEAAVLRAHPAPLVLRLGWLFGGAPGQLKNFVWGRLKEAVGKAEIGSNPGQTGNPTAVTDVAAQTLALVAAGTTGIVNCVGGGMPATRLDYVAAILQAAGSAVPVKPVVFPRRAPVSPNESARNARLQELGLDRMGEWRGALAAYVRTLPDPAAA